MLVRSSRPQRRSRRGVAAVELAVLLPFLVMVLLYAVDFGLIFYGSLSTGNAASNAGYYEVYQNAGDLYPDASDNAAVADDTSDLPSNTLTVTPGNTTDSAGNPVKSITVQYQFTSFSGIINPSVTKVTRTAYARVAPATPN